MPNFIHKAVHGDSSPGSPSKPPARCDFFVGLDALWEFLTVEEWAPGDPRVSGTILMFTEQGSCKVCLNDRDQGAVAFVTGGDHSDALIAADEALRAGTIDWRPSRAKQARRGK